MTTIVQNKINATTPHAPAPPAHDVQAEVRRTLSALFAPGECAEVRALGMLRGKGVVSGYYTDWDKLARDVAQADARPASGQARPRQVYVSLNRVNPSLLARAANRLKEASDGVTTDGDIVRRTLLLVDCDPIRPSGISSTDAELEAARQTARDVWRYLKAEGWPDPILADSGNGAHLLYRLDLPVTDGITRLIQDCLTSLASRFDTAGVRIDTVVANPARVTRLYGTWTRKGDDTPQRPHRPSRLRRVPEVFAPVDVELLEALAAQVPDVTPSVSPASFESAFDMEGFIRRHSLNTSPGKAYQGGTKWQMDCPFNPAHTSPDAALFVTASGAAGFKCLHDGCRGSDWQALKAHLGEGEIRLGRQAERAMRREVNSERAREADDLPVIETNRRHLRDVSQDALAALVKANYVPSVFVRGGRLVRIVTDEDAIPTIACFTLDTLRHRLARVANCVSTSEERGTLPVAPPTALVADVLGYPSFDFLPALESIVTSPVVAESGTLVTTPGYVPDARVFYHETDPRLPGALGDTTPTPPNVADAKALILEKLLGDFPFEEQASRAHAFCALIQPFVRACIGGNTPLFLIDAPTQGTGKSLLAETICAVFQGRIPSSTPVPERKSDDEWRKLLTTALMEGPSHVWFDNLKYRLDSGALAQALTSQSWRDRLLGGNESVTVPVRCTWLLTANNIELDADFPRRSIWVRLNARQERPEDRDVNGFSISDLQSFVLAERPRLIRALVILLRAWLEAGRPLWTGTPIGSYTGWCRVMGGILDVLQIPGFLGNRERLYVRADPERERWHNFVLGWQAQHGDRPVPSSALIELAAQCEIVPDLERGSKNLFGKRLRERVEQVIAGHVVLNAGTRSGAALYRLVAGPQHQNGEPHPRPLSQSAHSSLGEGSNNDSLCVGAGLALPCASSALPCSSSTLPCSSSTLPCASPATASGQIAPTPFPSPAAGEGRAEAEPVTVSGKEEQPNSPLSQRSGVGEGPGVRFCLPPVKEVKESESFSPAPATTGSDSPVPGTTNSGRNDSLSFTSFTRQEENESKEETEEGLDDHRRQGVRSWATVTCGVGEDDEPLTDPFADDEEADDAPSPPAQHLTPNTQHPLLTFGLVTLAGERHIEAHLTYQGWHEIGIGTSRDDALADLRHNVTAQPDDEDLRKEKLAIIERIVRGP